MYLVNAMPLKAQPVAKGRSSALKEVIQNDKEE